MAMGLRVERVTWMAGAEVDMDKALYIDCHVRCK